mgnify:FL=1
MAAIAVEKGTAFNRQCGVNDVAFDAGGRRQLNLARADGACNASTDHDSLCNDLAFDRGFLTNGQSTGANIAFNRTVKLDLTFGGNGSGHDQIAAEDGGGFRFHV